MWSQVLCMRSMSGGTCPPCRTCCRISAQWAIAREWSFLARLSARPDHHDAFWAACAPAAGVAAGLVCCCCGAQAAKPAASSTAQPAPTPFLRPITAVSFCSSGCAPVGRIRRLSHAMLVPSDAGTQGSGAPGRRQQNFVALGLR